MLRWILLCTLRWPDSTNYKLLATITTFKRFQSTVNSAVLNKTSWLCKSFATNRTCKRFLSTLNSDVHFKVTWCCKSFVTNRTYKRFLSTINVVVGNKLTWLCKSFATISTFKWFHSGMTSPVYCHLCTTFTAFCHILCTCIYPYEYSHEDAGFVETRNVSHTHYMNAFSRSALIFQWFNSVKVKIHFSTVSFLITVNTVVCMWPSSVITQIHVV